LALIQFDSSMKHCVFLVANVEASEAIPCTAYDYLDPAGH